MASLNERKEENGPGSDNCRGGALCTLWLRRCGRSERTLLDWGTRRLYCPDRFGGMANRRLCQPPISIYFLLRQSSFGKAFGKTILRKRQNASGRWSLPKRRLHANSSTDCVGKPRGSRFFCENTDVDQRTISPPFPRRMVRRIGVGFLSAPAQNSIRASTFTMAGLSTRNGNGNGHLWEGN